MPAQVLCFGELLLRLGAPGRELLLQSPRLEVFVGGAEANVAVSLAKFGHRTALTGVLPDNALGMAALAEMRRYGVDVSQVRQSGHGRMGLYFLSQGAMHRPSEVIYDRAGSAFALADAADYDWPRLLSGVDWLHMSGVTPALGAQCAEAALAAARNARKLGVHVSFDGNYRPKLWQASRGDAPAILKGIMAEADILFADHRDMAVVLQSGFEGDSPEALFVKAAEAAFREFPQLERFASTVRVQHSVDHHSLSALMVTRDGTKHRSPAKELSHIVDRIGGGDAFAAGLLHGLLTGMDDAQSLHFGLAAACLKHSVPGDVNLLGAEDVAAFANDGRFDVRR